MADSAFFRRASPVTRAFGHAVRVPDPTCVKVRSANWTAGRAEIGILGVWVRLPGGTTLAVVAGRERSSEGRPTREIRIVRAWLRLTGRTTF